MNYKILPLLLLCLKPSYAEERYITSEGTYIIPDSNKSWGRTNDPKIMHNNLILFQSIGNRKKPPKTCETPASLACLYSLTKQVPGCPIKGTTAVPKGGWGAIAVVEAYHNPYAEKDLKVFSEEFGLPLCTKANGCFSVVHTGNHIPPFNAASADEHVLDIEWAHAMAPNAKIIMVEAQNESFEEHIKAIHLASQQVAASGGGLVSISWSISEFPEEKNYDAFFQTPGIVYIASSGDYSAPARYPSSSPYVISAGGTSVIRDVQGNFLMETAWSTNPDTPVGEKSGGSGGPSLYESRPAFQNSVMRIVGKARGTPDISFNADPKTGVCVYSTVHGGWLKDGGTSVSAPALAGIINSANRRAKTTQEELTYIYNSAIKNYHAYWHDILEGNNGFPALVGYDFVTGLGSPRSYKGK
ncbi:S53 family peptidase [Legionella hackeliae]|nr:S53 family peptidase [Legionella hackeliae]KTD15278.1 serine protease, subtilase family [Legionella hackeliae]STX48126.1 serine protease, subtilase family [Legionella hackeliae]